MRFGGLVAVAFAHRYKDTRASVWKCRCDFGAETFVILGNLTRGQTTSCGCKVRTAKGLTRTEAYTARSYFAMLRRCTDPSFWRYAEYGGRGISVYFDWMGKGGFENFLKDMGPRPYGLTLDRKDNDGNYDPWNCRWADASTQRLNQRRETGKPVLERDCE